MSERAGLRAEDLVVYYGHARAVWNVTVDVPAGRITALVGPNGAGKSSTLLAAYGSVKASGRVLFGGRDVSAQSATSRARSGMALVPQGRQVFPTLTVRDNLVVMCRLLGVSLDRIQTAYDRFPILRERSRHIAGVLSGGEQQMLAVSRALLGSPRVVLFDEMATGLAPMVIDRLLETARQLAHDGVAVLMAEPSIGNIRTTVDRGYVLLRGEVVATAESSRSLEDEYERALGMEVAEAAVD